MRENTWRIAQKCAKNWNGPGGASTPFPTLEHSQPVKEAEAMSLWVHIGDSRRDFKTEQYTTGGV